MDFTLEHYSKFLPSNFIVETAKKTSFTTRNKGISPVAFLNMMLNPNLDVASDSLSEISLEFSKLGISVTRQSIFEKLNQSCVDFLESVLKFLIAKTHNNRKIIDFDGVSEDTPQIVIADTSTITLDPMHSEKYPGLSSKLKSMLKILLAIDPRTLSITSFELSEGRKSDQNFNETLLEFPKSSLLLKDLGFTSIKDQEAIEVREGKYISRVRLNTDFYTMKTPKQMKNGKIVKGSNFEKVNITELYKNLVEGEVVDTNYYFKNSENFYSRRVIITKVPADKLEKRIKATENKLRDSDKEITPKTRAMIPFNIYVTNLTSEEMPSKKIHSVYAKRWEIELLFKKLKSTYNIDKVKDKVKIERILIQVYSKLILFALECLYSQDIAKALPETNVSSAKIGNFFKSYFEVLFRTGKEVKISLKSLGIQLKKDIKKSKPIK